MKKLSMRTEKVLSVQETHEQYMRKCAVRNLSPKTLTLYSDHFQVFQRFLENNGRINVSDITLTAVEDFILYLKETRQCKDVSINSYLRSLRGYLNACMDEGLSPRLR